MVFFRDLGRQRAVREKVDFCLVNVPTFVSGSRLKPRSMPLARRLSELTTFFTFFSLQLPVSELAYVDSIDAALHRGTKDFCLIQNAGHLFYGQADLSYDLEAAMEKCGLVTGFLQPADGYCSLNPNCVLINRRAWERCGKPAFGDPGSASRTLPRAQMNTASEISAEGSAALVETDFGYGWNMIAASLAAGISVSAWSEKFQRWSRTFDTHSGKDANWIMALTDPIAAPDFPDQYLRAALDFLRNTPDRVSSERKIFVINTEGDENIPKLRFRPGLDRAFVVASGFKANRILETFGFHDGTEVITYDYSRPALAFRQALVKEWDGVDFARFFAAIRPQIDARFPGQVSYLPEHITSDPDALTREFERENREVFPSHAEWLAHWRRFTALKHHFVLADIFQPAELEALIRDHGAGRTAIWISDIFNSPNAVTKMPWERRQMHFDTMKTLLAKFTAADLIIGDFPVYWLPQR